MQIVEDGAGRARPGLRISSWASLISAIEESMAVDGSESLRGWLRGYVGCALPHRAFFCVLGAIGGGRIAERYSLCDGGLERYVARHRQSEGRWSTPALRTWIARNAPVSDADLDRADVDALRVDAVERLIAFGFIDPVGGVASYCELADVRLPVTQETLYAAGLLAPHLHAVLLRVAAAESAGASSAGQPGALTPREREVLRWISEGKSVWETAKILGRSEHTVKNQVRRVYSKLGIHTRIQAARIADRLLHAGPGRG